MRQGIRPKIWAVEYNSAYGPEKAITIKYQPDFRRANDGNGKLYYGCSIAGWVKLMGGYGYSFIGVDSCGVNAFFVNPDEFEQGFIKQIKATNFKENVSQMREFRKTWEGQFALIQNMEFENVL
ncbi:hypothetical protein HY768_03225 [candidate division TA06 bacterium]|uniref:Uncharacterized protein n=1 Tax=candidate division TA06 bacterium TaxID=2250710 RepID=A0A933MK03_UNCT6|nr:hypothetical protein [candidate division TA06 bacterium]